MSLLNKYKKFVLMTALREYKEGEGSYSPGLEYDAKVYKDWLTNSNKEVRIQNTWASKEELSDSLENLKWADVIIGIEEFGIEEFYPLINEKITIWIPNLEIESTYIKNMYTGLTRLDYIICKTEKSPIFIKLIQPVIKKFINLSASPKILFIPHCTPSLFSDFDKEKEKDGGAIVSSCFNDELLISSEFREKKRKNIIHFAGSSPYKNTLEQVYAGLNIVKKYPSIFDKLIIKITSWPNRFALDSVTLNKLDELAKKNSSKIIYLKGGWILDSEKADLLLGSSIALCVSGSEGFGHYIMEALESGCMVITTDGWPMNMLPKSSQLQMVKFTDCKRLRNGLEYTLPAAKIIQTLEKTLIPLLEEKKYDPIKSYEVWQIQNERFSATMKSVFG